MTFSATKAGVFTGSVRGSSVVTEADAAFLGSGPKRFGVLVSSYRYGGFFGFTDG